MRNTIVVPADDKFLCFCDGKAETTGGTAMDYYDVGDHTRAVTTTSPDAQLWFNRGLVWGFAYFHDEAIACFHKAIEADPDCAMAYWGVAYATGPNYNLPWERRDEAMKQTSLAAAYDATQAAMERVATAKPAEQALIKALQARFPTREPAKIEVMRGWNDAFADAMRTVHAAYPDDLDLTAVFVEAIMNRTPWNMWDQSTGEPAKGAGTQEAQAVLEAALQDKPQAMQHPGILHLYVHLMEMSPVPERALKAGDALRELVPDAGHLIHMPTHIDIQCGHYRDVFHWNWKATQVDQKALDRMGVYTVYTGYRIHNYHFATYGAMFLGQFEPAWKAARALVDVTPEDLLRVTSPPFADFFESYMAIWVHVLIRFGRWQQIIDEALPDDPALYANLTATLHYAKGVAHAATGDVAKAESERSLFLAARDAMPAARRMHNVLCTEQLAVAEAMLDGEIEYRRQNYDLAFARLRDAVGLEDALPYDEPWGWMQPSRHALGALLLEQGRIDEAEAVYREDLGLGGDLTRAQIHPDNVWSLAGLNDCIVARGGQATPEGRLIAQRLKLAESRCDTKVGASCFCAQAAE
ncbi:MAG: tetratricopeptide repeat protein [Sulfitobacter sp.]